MPARRRTSFNLTLRAKRTLEDLAQKQGRSMTEVVQDAIALQQWFDEIRAQGSRLIVRDREGSMRELISL